MTTCTQNDFVYIKYTYTDTGHRFTMYVVVPYQAKLEPHNWDYCCQNSDSGPNSDAANVYEFMQYRIFLWLGNGRPSTEVVLLLRWS